jgi:hypothetical protein
MVQLLTKIEIFAFVLSIVFCSKHLIRLLMALNQENPEPMIVSKTEKVLLYFASAYIITFIIGIFI